MSTLLLQQQLASKFNSEKEWLQVVVGPHTLLRLKGTPALAFHAGMTIDADGAPDAYHPDSVSGRDDLANAGRPGNWWALVTDTGTPRGTPLIQGPTDPAEGFYISMTALEDPSRDRADPRRYVNSATVPYVVLPPAVLTELDIHLGDLAVVINKTTGQYSGAIIADVGPASHLGEASIRLADMLGVASNPRGGGVEGGILYLVFAGSGIGRPQPVEVIERQANKLFSDIGGLAVLLTSITAG